MKKLKLNTDKIEQEMKRIGVTRTWLAKQLSVTPAMVTYIFHYRPVSYAVKIAPLFGMEPKDLVGVTK